MKIQFNKSSIIQIALLPFIFSGLFIVNLYASTEDINLQRNKSGALQLPDSSVYEGETKDGVFHGKGKLTWSNGSVYQGEFKNGLMHGKGTHKLISGAYYKGSMKQGLKSGKGTLTFANGDIYTGDFSNDALDGMGELQMSNGATYNGHFKKDEFNGEGKFTSSNGDIYQGQFVNSEASGASKILYENGDVYTGNLTNWHMDGTGEFRIKDGMIYTGEFVKGNMQGKGEVKFPSGDVYKGDIGYWSGNGNGELITKDEGTYLGEFKNGAYHGQGILTYPNGNTYQGEFENGLRHGKGTFVKKNPKGSKKNLVGWWQYGRYSGSDKPSKTRNKKKPNKVDGEAIFYNQHKLLSTVLSSLKFETPYEPDLYMLAFGSAGYQDVFMKEVEYSRTYFDLKLGTRGRSIGLINNHKVAKKVPMASVSNLKISLDTLSRVMDKEQDILFLFLTSHGSRKHELSVSLRGLKLNNLPASKLASLLKNTGIKWKVIVISACYSGGFIDELKDDYTMIMTVSKSDNVSFGCSDDAEFTYFGRAFFKEALPQSKTFRQAFDRAKDIVAKMEDKEDFSHSEPQFYSTPKIEAQLKLWRKSF